MIPWDAPGPYAVAFTTREGGVSEGAFASLNLGSRGDDPVHVAENRRRACAALGLALERLSIGRQRHTAIVNRAQAGVHGVDGDALWTDEPGLPMLALTADCLPIAVAAVDRPPALALVHAGWRGLACGIVEQAVGALGAGETAAIVGPAVGPCYYSVRPGSRHFGPTRDGMLDRRAAGRGARTGGSGARRRRPLHLRPSGRSSRTAAAVDHAERKA